MKVLVTGASGRFAYFMVKALRGRHDIVLTSRQAVPEDRADLPWIQGDLNNWEDCVKAVRGVDAIQALGAVPSPSDVAGYNERRAQMGMAPRPFDATMMTNIMGLYYLVKAAAEAGVKTFVYTGSNCAFGHGFRVSSIPFPINYLPLDEKHPSNAEDSYSFSKHAGEELLNWFTQAYGIRTYITRPAGICPPERLQKMAETAVPCTGWSDWMYGYVPSEDLAQMQLMCMEKAEQLPAHDVFVANGADSTLLEPSLEIIGKYRPDLLPVSQAMTGHRAFFSIEHAQKVLGWTPKHSWRDYLK